MKLYDTLRAWVNGRTLRDQASVDIEDQKFRTMRLHEMTPPPNNGIYMVIVKNQVLTMKDAKSIMRFLDAHDIRAMMVFVPDPHSDIRVSFLPDGLLAIEGNEEELSDE